MMEPTPTTGDRTPQICLVDSGSHSVRLKFRRNFFILISLFPSLFIVSLHLLIFHSLLSVFFLIERRNRDFHQNGAPEFFNLPFFDLHCYFRRFWPISGYFSDRYSCSTNHHSSSYFRSSSCYAITTSRCYSSSCFRTSTCYSTTGDSPSCYTTTSHSTSCYSTTSLSSTSDSTTGDSSPCYSATGDSSSCYSTTCCSTTGSSRLSSRSGSSSCSKQAEIEGSITVSVGSQSTVATSWGSGAWIGSTRSCSCRLRYEWSRKDIDKAEDGWRFSHWIGFLMVAALERCLSSVIFLEIMLLLFGYIYNPARR